MKTKSNFSRFPCLISSSKSSKITIAEPIFGSTSTSGQQVLKFALATDCLFSQNSIVVNFPFVSFNAFKIQIPL